MGLKLDDDSSPSPPKGGRASIDNGGAPNRRASITGTVLGTLEQEFKDQRKLEARRARAAWLILPNSTFLKVWLAIIGPLIVYTAIWVPLEVSQMATADTLHGQIDFILDFFFYVDIVINFRTAYIDDENELVLNSKLIAKRYFRGFFWVDLGATLQFELFFFGAHPFKEQDTDAGGFSAAAGVFRLPRLIRFIRLFKKLDMFPHLKIAKVRERRSSHALASPSLTDPFRPPLLLSTHRSSSSSS